MKSKYLLFTVLSLSLAGNALAQERKLIDEPEFVEALRQKNEAVIASNPEANSYLIR